MNKRRNFGKDNIIVKYRVLITRDVIKEYVQSRVGENFRSARFKCRSKRSGEYFALLRNWVKYQSLARARLLEITASFDWEYGVLHIRCRTKLPKGRRNKGRGENSSYIRILMVYGRSDSSQLRNNVFRLSLDLMKFLGELLTTFRAIF